MRILCASWSHTYLVRPLGRDQAPSEKHLAGQPKAGDAGSEKAGSHVTPWRMLKRGWACKWAGRVANVQWFCGPWQSLMCEIDRLPQSFVCLGRQVTTPLLRKHPNTLSPALTRETQADKGSGKLAFLGGHTNVRGQGQGQAAAGGKAVHGRDEGLRHRPDLLDQPGEQLLGPDVVIVPGLAADAEGRGLGW